MAGSPTPFTPKVKSPTLRKAIGTPKNYRSTKQLKLSDQKPKSRKAPSKILFNFDIKNVNIFRNAKGSKKKHCRQVTEGKSNSPLSEKKLCKKPKSPAKGKLTMKVGTHRKSRSQEVVPFYVGGVEKVVTTEY
jgi:hypothetical protein